MKIAHLALVVAIGGSLMTAGAASAQTAEETKAAETEIWALEQSIYLGRQQGDMTNYRNNVAEGYLSWPPTTAAPMRADNLGQAGSRHAANERLTMTFRDFALNGDVAVIYYNTHRTQRSDGTAADDRFDTTHTWIRRDGKWVVFGGMARASQRP